MHFMISAYEVNLERIYHLFCSKMCSGNYEEAFPLTYFYFFFFLLLLISILPKDELQKCGY